eukprot:3856996-Rhodomonas_salina.2
MLTFWGQGLKLLPLLGTALRELKNSKEELKKSREELKISEEERRTLKEENEILRSQLARFGENAVREPTSTATSYPVGSRTSARRIASQRVARADEDFHMAVTAQTKQE